MARCVVDAKIGFRTTENKDDFFRENRVKFYVAWWLSLALLAGDASEDSGFREIHVPRAWRVYLATGLDFREKSRARFGSIGARLWRKASYLATLL